VNAADRANMLVITGLRDEITEPGRAGPDDIRSAAARPGSVTSSRIHERIHEITILRPIRIPEPRIVRGIHEPRPPAESVFPVCRLAL